MESGITNETKLTIGETENVKNTDSADSFQSFIYELFEKNGILNDVRAYLRGHIVNVLKSAQTGEPPPCQKNFTQRLDLTYQALNMLIAEYLMRLKFSYSFSVFISEIPLANMVFGFAKTLMGKVDEDCSEMRFKEEEVWSILNYLGLQCDSEHASNILQMYKSESQDPLLLCILKSMPMYKENATPKSRSVDPLESSKSSETEAAHNNNVTLPECSHCAYCTKCRNKMYKLKDRYKKKKKCLAKNSNKYKASASISPAYSESVVKNISIVEKSLIEEMFQQMKSVYETEVEMVMVEEEKKVKRSIATHAMQLQQKRNELEESFKAREQELERNVQQKKKFLWGLARSLRDQHQHMTRAMHDVRAHTERLQVQESSLKNQLAEAEEILKKRGEELRAQISKELAILEAHLETMKKERENITRECSELENLKSIHASTSEVNKRHKMEIEEIHSHFDLLKNELKTLKTYLNIKTIQDSTSEVIKHKMETDQIHSHFDLLKNEFEILKTYLDSLQMPVKCVVERGTITDVAEPVSQTNIALNNTQGNEKPYKSDDSDERVKMNQVVNDFRKKNVNLSQSNLDEIYHESGHDRSRSSNSSEAGDAAAPGLELERGRDRDLIQRLREENDRLKALTRLRVQAHTAPRPHTAPEAPPHGHNNLNASISASTLNVGWRKGAGEELNMFSGTQPRILVPGDTLPFIGVLRDRHGNSRRPAAVSRTRPLAGVSKRAATPDRERHAAGTSGSRQALPEPSCSLPPADTCPPKSDPLQQHSRAASGAENRNEEQSTSTIKDTKENLRRKESTRSGTHARDMSPTSVLREAKQRLRRLEIEAAAVDQSYRDFRRRQTERRAARDPTDNLAKAFDVSRSHSAHELDETTRNDIETNFVDLQMTTMRSDIDKYLRDYTTKFDIVETHFRNEPSVSEKVQPIPDSLGADCTEDLGVNSIKHNDVHENYLEAPLTEFRKLYTSARQIRRDDTRSIHSVNSVNMTEFEDSARNNLRKQNKQAEVEILRQNISQLYHTPNRDSSATENQQIIPANADHENDLRVEVESIRELNGIKSQSQELLLVVQSSVNSHDVTVSGGEVASEVFSARMTIIVSPKRPSDSPRHTDSSPRHVDRSPQNDVDRSPLHSVRNPQNVDRSPLHSNRSPQHVNRSPLHSDRNPQAVDRSPLHSNRRPQHVDCSPLHSDRNPQAVDRSPLHSNRRPQHVDRSPLHSDRNPQNVDRSPLHSIRNPQDVDRSPLQSNRSPLHSARSPAPEQAAHLTRNDVLDAIFHANADNVSSVQMRLELSKDEVPMSEYDKGDYPSIEENYISHSDTDRSRLSLPAMDGGDTAEDDNFWET